MKSLLCVFTGVSALGGGVAAITTTYNQTQQVEITSSNDHNISLKAITDKESTQPVTKSTGVGMFADWDYKATAKWYWFGYWYLWVNHAMAQDIASGAATAASLADYFVSVPEIGALMRETSRIMLAFQSSIQKKDTGNGVYIDILGFIPISVSTAK
jgi:hypothetical protein